MNINFAHIAEEKLSNLSMEGENRTMKEATPNLPFESDSWRSDFKREKG